MYMTLWIHMGICLNWDEWSNYALLANGSFGVMQLLFYGKTRENRYR